MAGFHHKNTITSFEKEALLRDDIMWQLSAQALEVECLNLNPDSTTYLLCDLGT